MLTVLLCFMAIEVCFVAEGKAIASEFFANVGFGVPLPMFPETL